MQKKCFLLMCVLMLMLSLSACSFLPARTQDATPKYLSEREAINAMIEFARPNLALAIGIPSYATDVFKMNSYKIENAVHYESAGFWHFDVKGKIPMAEDGLLWYIHYSFDAKVDDQTGSVTMGELRLFNENGT